MPFSRFFLDSTIIDFKEPISSSDIRKVLADKEGKRLQTSQPISEKTWKKLNKEVFAKRPELLLRVCCNWSVRYDLAFARLMTNVRHFTASALKRVKNLEAIGEIPQLESLGLGVYELESFEALNGVSAKLKKLTLEKTKSKKPDLAPLERFRNLRVLYLEGQQKNIEVLAELKKLEDVTLRSVSPPDLEFLSQHQKLWSLDLKLGGIKDLSAIAKFPSLKYLELWQIRGLENLDFISKLSGLQHLFLQSLSRIKSIPDLRACQSLRRMRVQNLRAVQDWSALEHAPALEEFTLSEAEKTSPRELVPLLKNPHLKSACGYFGSLKKNKEFVSLLDEHGKAEYQYSPFKYR